MKKTDIQKYASALGKKSAEARRKKYGKNLSKIMSHIRKGKTMAQYEDEKLSTGKV